MNDVFHTYTDAVTRTYARLADLYKDTVDDYWDMVRQGNPAAAPGSPLKVTYDLVSEAFRGLHKDLTTAFDLDTDATPDRVVTAVYAHYTAHGGEATARKLLDEVDVEHAWSTYPAAR